MKAQFNMFEEIQIHQVLCALLICVPMFYYGNTIGWMSPMILLLQSEQSPNGVPLTDAEPLLISTCAVSGASMVLLATWFLLNRFSISSPAWIPVVTLCVYIFCDAAGLMPITLIVIGEIFSYKYRGTVLATTMAIASLSDFFQLLFFKSMVRSISVYIPFYFFGLICLVTVIYVYMVVPETKKRKLEEIYNDMGTKKEKVLQQQPKLNLDCITLKTK